MPRFRRSMLGLAIVVSKGDRWTNRVSMSWADYLE